MGVPGGVAFVGVQLGTIAVFIVAVINANTIGIGEFCGPVMVVVIPGVVTAGAAVLRVGERQDIAIAVVGGGNNAATGVGAASLASQMLPAFGRTLFRVTCRTH